MDVLALLPLGGSGAMPNGERLGRSLSRLYRTWNDGDGVDLVALAEGLLLRLGVGDEPIGAVCRQVARDVVVWNGHPYHSANHHAEVTTNAMVLVELSARAGSRMPPYWQRLLLASCLAHDIHYQPSPTPRRRFESEEVSADALDRIGLRYRLPEPDRHALRCLVLATEPGSRVCLRAILAETASPNDVPAPLVPLLADRALAETAAVLSDADLLSSAGLTEAWHDVQVERLQRELGHPIIPADDLAFIERVVGPGFLSVGGRVFDANLERIGERVRRMAQGAGRRA